MTAESATPRSDKEIIRDASVESGPAYDQMMLGEVVTADFARTLERELAQVTVDFNAAVLRARAADKYTEQAEAKNAKILEVLGRCRPTIASGTKLVRREGFEAAARDGESILADLDAILKEGK